MVCDVDKDSLEHNQRVVCVSVRVEIRALKELNFGELD